MFTLLTFPSSRAISEWLTRGWWFGVNLPYSVHQTKPGSRAGKAFHYPVQLRAGNISTSVWEKRFPSEKNKPVYPSHGRRQQGPCPNPKRLLPTRLKQSAILLLRITAARMSGMQGAQYYYVGNPLLNLYVVQVLVISIMQKKGKIKQEYNPFSPYQEYKESRTTWLKPNKKIYQI